MERALTEAESLKNDGLSRGCNHWQKQLQDRSAKFDSRSTMERIVLQPGVFAVIPIGAGTELPAIEAAWQVASELFASCFISGWSAAEHWALTDQILNAVSV